MESEKSLFGQKDLAPQTVNGHGSWSIVEGRVSIVYRSSPFFRMVDDPWSFFQLFLTRSSHS
ncbi:MAG: hypothetical protein WBM17_05615, partial [Anaerolineales bacterium]